MVYSKSVVSFISVVSVSVDAICDFYTRVNEERELSESYDDRVMLGFSIRLSLC